MRVCRLSGFLLLFLAFLPANGLAEEKKLEVIKIFWGSADEIAPSLYPLKSKEGKIIPDSRSNSIIVNDYPENVSAIKELAAKLDIRLNQAKVKVGFVDKKILEESGIKVRWVVSGDGAWSIGNIRPEVSGGSKVEVSGFIESEGLKSRTEQTLLLMENAKGSIFVGSSIPYQEEIVGFGKDRGYISRGTTFKDVGTSFSVTLRVIDKENIQVRITPSISRGGGKENIEFSSASTLLLVKNGETVLLGGNDEKSESFGRRFLAGASASKKETEMAMTLSVHIVE